ncbi:conjugal transfer protein TraF [Vibrio zhanjiangensis]|uniref:Conjugal transfer protein TraF n=1 Tax=Vibrio zhanjiangensis TaxID=1046128 RepID=A0ABQ6F7A0_9VIBR|nr:type-F conjugative transfer system pilin assembly protein TraF [Vibrio zhanjiangensis]GLT20480.1 conjugal transfer protein TraF [Vibrio zhanjiangensis]
MNPYTTAPFAAIVALILSTLVLYPPNLLAQTPPGWRFYNEPIAPKVQPKPKPTPAPSAPQKVMSATEQLAWFHKEWNEAKAAAMIDPHNEEKLHRLLTLNRYITEQTSVTEMTFKKLLAENPELSYTKDHPTEQSARKVYLSKLKDKHERKVTEMMRLGWGLFFVYDSTDTLAMTLAPSIQQFADRYQLDLLGVSNDGAFSKDIRDNRANHGKFKVKHLPALLLVNPKTGQTKPLAYGFIAQSQLLRRFYNVATDFKDANS